MKALTSFPSRAICLLVILFLFQNADAQVQTARNISTGPNSNGFYEYLPQGYSSGTAKYPLVIFVHGSGELGNGGSDLPTVLRNGPPKLISQGKFPTSFTVKGHTYSFIVISPQFVAWPSNSDVDKVIRYAVDHYRVDTGRIYLTGLSMGGGVTWAYAADPTNSKMLAAILPVAGGQLWSGKGGATLIATANLPIFAAANLNDNVVPSVTTVDNINLINSIVPAIQPKALDTIYNANGHEGWSTTYDPATNLHDGLNAYQWMLQYSRNMPEAPLPAKLTDYSAVLTPDKSRVIVSWTTSSEQNNSHFILQRSTDGQTFSDLDTIPAASGAENGHSYTSIDTRPLTGANFYRLAQVDLDGNKTWFDILKVDVVQDTSNNGNNNNSPLRLSPNPSAGAIHLEMTNSAMGNLQVRFSDVQGRVLRTWSFNKQDLSWTQTIDPGALPAGIYFITIEAGTLKEVRQLVRN
ncbi:MAG TPA: T9SS type A sorting domain-containing protein [Puia sp.]|jgi:pimeloyl-ACP methyl ester carboxylesterase